MTDTKLHNHIMRIIVLFMRWVLKIEEIHCIGTNDKKHPDIKSYGSKTSHQSGYIGNYLDHLQPF